MDGLQNPPSSAKRAEIQQRILLGLAMTDFITSLHYVIGTVPFPQDDGGYGNEMTCNVSGFIGQFVPSTAIYNAFLGLFYLCTIKYGWRDEALKKLEWTCHISALSFALVTGIICLHLELFNPAFIHCWIADHPKGCTQDPNVECTRGDGNLALALGWGFYYVPVYIGFVVASFSMWLVYWHVRSVEKATLKYSVRALSTPVLSGLSSDENAASIVSGAFRQAKISQQRKEEEKRKLQLSRQVFKQGMWYLFAFFATWFWPTVTTICESFGYYYYWILVLLAITLPMQGFLNWIVYIRPRFLRYREKHDQWSFGYALMRALAKPFGCFPKSQDEDHAPRKKGLLSSTKTTMTRNDSSSGINTTTTLPGAETTFTKSGVSQMIPEEENEEEEEESNEGTSKEYNL